MDRNLSHIDEHIVKTRTNKDGTSVYDFIRNHVKAKNITNGRLSTAFWTRFWQEFDLTCDISSQLPQPQGGSNDDIDEEPSSWPGTRTRPTALQPPWCATSRRRP